MSVEMVDRVEGKFCKKADEIELGRESRRGKILGSVAKYWAMVKTEWRGQTTKTVL
jgi:hypothetical protein